LGAFLEPNDLAMLTGRKVKSKQIEALRKMGIAFFINACGKPIVPTSAIEGRSIDHHKKQWEMPTFGQPYGSKANIK